MVKNLIKTGCSFSVDFSLSFQTILCSCFDMIALLFVLLQDAKQTFLKKVGGMSNLMRRVQHLPGLPQLQR